MRALGPALTEGPDRSLEEQRLGLQATLDAQKTLASRNELGQFATPTPLARQVVELGLSLVRGSGPVRFLDPALGTGSFFSALVASGREVAAARGYELDPHYGEPARALWAGHGLDVRLADFTRTEPEPAFELVVSNPPYVRHHHLAPADKARLVALSSAIAGRPVSALAGLYVHFALLSLSWLAPGGVAVWLVPSEFLDVGYGAALREVLGSRVSLERLHRFHPREREFADALVTSAVVAVRREAPAPGHRALVSWGGSLERPEGSRAVSRGELAATPKWSRLVSALGPAPLAPASSAPAGKPLGRVGDLFVARRGLVTGGNEVFVLAEERARALGLPAEVLRPLLPPPRRLRVSEVLADERGMPSNTERVVLVDCRLSEAEVRDRHPALHRYLEAGRARVGEGYLCRRRTPWYTQEARSPAPIVCTYMGRGDRAGLAKPLRFVRNRSEAVVSNVYLQLTPRPGLSLSEAQLDAVWRQLASLDAAALVHAGRVYGGGLVKLEPRELLELPLPAELVAEALEPALAAPLAPPPHAPGAKGLAFTRPQPNASPARSRSA